MNDLGALVEVMLNLLPLDHITVEPKPMNFRRTVRGGELPFSSLAGFAHSASSVAPAACFERVTGAL